MTVKESMNQYFEMRKKLAENGLDFLFKTPFNDEVDSLIYIGEVNQEDYITWVPVEKETIFEFKAIEKELDTNFHPSVVEYFNSYWFVDLDGFINDYYIKLESVLPSFNLESFRTKLENYKNNHNGRLDNIPLGIEGNGLILLVDNNDGTVRLEDFESGTYDVIARSIQELIQQLRLIR